MPSTFYTFYYWCGYKTDEYCCENFSMGNINKTWRFTLYRISQSTLCLQYSVTFDPFSTYFFVIKWTSTLDCPSAKKRWGKETCVIEIQSKPFLQLLFSSDDTQSCLYRMFVFFLALAISWLVFKRVERENRFRSFLLTFFLWGRNCKTQRNDVLIWMSLFRWDGGRSLWIDFERTFMWECGLKLDHCG